MLKHYLCIILFFCFLIVQGQSSPIGQWQVYLPYKSFSGLVDVDNTIYFGTNHSFICSYEADSKELYAFSNLDGFAEPEVAEMAYSTDYETLILGYQNSNIDIVKNGELVNFPEIKNKTIVGDKQIYDFHFVDSLVYVSCGFGIVVLDVVKEEVKDTYFIGPQGDRIRINEVVDDGNTVMAATELGVFSADLSDPNLINFNNWYQHDITDGLPLDKEATSIAFFNNHFYVALGNVLYEWQNDTWVSVYQTALVPDNPDARWDIVSMHSSSTQLTLTENLMIPLEGVFEINDGQIVSLTTELSPTTYNHPYIDRANNAIFHESSNKIWVSDTWKGTATIENGEFERPFIVNGPENNGAWKLAFNDQDLLIGPARITTNWGKGNDRSGFFQLHNGKWNSFSPNPRVDDIVDIETTNNGNTIYLASYGTGLIEFDKTTETFSIFNTENSSLLFANGDPTSCRASGLAIDNNNHLWVSNYLGVRPLSVKTNEGVWQSFDPDLPVSYEDRPTEIVVDNYNTLWVVMRSSGIMAMNYGDDIENIGDDQYRLFQKIDFNNGIPSNAATCIALDKDDEIWVGTDGGIAIFYCANDPFNENCEFSKPIVQLEGENEPVFVLGGVSITSIAVDPADRKWIGTNQGVLLLSPDGKETIRQFTTENSPLLSNEIRDIEINAATGVVYFGTTKGVNSYQSDALDGTGQNGDVLVYPNPVHPEYEGDIAIRGLVNNANVKITDISGQLIFETTALGGQAIWDGNNYNGVRAQTGVYLVLCSSPDGSETVSTKLFLVN